MFFAQRFWIWSLLCSLTVATVTAQTTVVVNVTTGSFANEVAWELYDGSGALVAFRNCGDYFDTGSSSSDTLSLNPGEFYTFQALDDWGDGWNGGIYSIERIGGCVIASGAPDDGVPGDGAGSCLVLSIEEEVIFDPLGTISGCTDPASANFNPCATIDDGSCISPAGNDDCTDAILIDIGGCYNGLYDGISFGGDLVAPPCLDSDPNPMDVWHKVEVPAAGGFVLEFSDVPGFSSIVELYTGDCGSLGTGILGAASSCINYGEGGQLTVTGLTPGDTVLIQYWDFGSNDFGPYTLCVNALPPASPNDDCASAIDIPVGACYYGTYSDVAFEADPVIPACVDGDLNPLDVWHTVTVPTSGNLLITFDSIPGVSSIVEIYEGTCGSLGSGILSSLDFCVNFAQGGSIALVELTPGAQLYIRYWDFASNDFGTYGLCVDEPPSGCTDSCASNYDPSAIADDGSCVYPLQSPDDCAAAIPLSEGANDFYTNGLTGNDVTSCTTRDSIDGWYSFTVPNGIDSLWIYTCGSSYDTGLSLWDACPSSGGVELACNDDGIRPGAGIGFAECGGALLQSAIVLSGSQLDALIGADLYVRIAGFDGATGCGSLNVEVVSEVVSACSTTDAPVNATHVTGASSTTLSWDAVTESVACLVTGTRISPPGPSPSLKIFGFEVTSAIVPHSVAGAGNTWSYRVRCACSIPPGPLELTPFSEPDTFLVPSLREVRGVEASLAPNATNSNAVWSVNAQAETEISITLVDLSGRVLWQKQVLLLQGANSIPLQFENLPSGLYFLNWKQDGREYSLDLEFLN